MDKIQFWKKKKNVIQEAKTEGERQKNINEPTYKISVYKTLGRDVPQEISCFFAIQKKDESGSLYLINEENNFRENLSISRHESIQKLYDRLEIKNLTEKEKAETLNKKIEEQEDLVRSIERGTILNKTNKDPIRVNAIDEAKKLRQLKVLKYVISHSEEGSFDSISSDGYRQRFYLYDEGALIPMFWDRKKASLFPAVDTAIKFYKADQDLINQDFADENRDKWLNIAKTLGIIVFSVLFLANMYWTYKINDYSQKVTTQAQAFAESVKDSNFGVCVATISTTNKQLLEIIDQYRTELNQSNAKNINSVTTDLR